MLATGNCKLNLKFPNNNQNYSITYEFNAKTTYESMIDYLAELFPQENLCLCTHLTVNNKAVKKDECVCKLCFKSANIEIIKEKNCKCDKILKEYFSKSKSQILNLLFDKIKKIENEKNMFQNLIDRESINISSINEIDLNNDISINNNINNNQNNDNNNIQNNNNNNNNNNNLNNNQNNNNNNNQIQIDQKTNKIKINSNNNEILKSLSNNFYEDFYDVIVNINSIKGISKGWEIKMNEKGEKNYNDFKTQKIIKIGIIGNSNKGKTFLLSKISKINLPSGTSIRTEGLSIKYPDLGLFKDRKIALLDSAGLENPVLKDEEYINNINNQNEKELFKEKSREKLITELFLQNYIMNNSDILIIVVGILTYSEQKLLNRIKTEIQRTKINKPLFIIHNLMTYTLKAQVEDYINKYLLKSATFDLELGHKITIKTKSKSGIYYYEKNSNPKIYHLIFANEGSEAGDSYNNFVLDFLENSFQTVTDLQNFDIIQSVKERFIELSKEIIEKKEEQKSFTLDDFENSENNKIIKLSKEQNLMLKKCLIDELGFSNLKANGFEPTYNYYRKDNDKLIVRIEGPGNCNFNTHLDFSGEYTIIRINGEKKKDKEPDKIEDNIYCTREFGVFSIDIPLKTEDYFLKNEEPKIIDKKGLLMLEFKLEQKKVDGFVYTTQEDDEV